MLPFVRRLDLRFERAVTFFVGEIMSEPVPVKLIERIAKLRAKESAERASSKRATAKRATAKQPTRKKR